MERDKQELCDGIGGGMACADVWTVGGALLSSCVLEAWRGQGGKEDSDGSNEAEDRRIEMSTRDQASLLMSWVLPR